MKKIKMSPYLEFKTVQSPAASQESQSVLEKCPVQEEQKKARLQMLLQP